MTPDLNQPVELPPHGAESNFEHPRGHVRLAYATLVVPLFAITVFTWVRFLFKLRVTRNLLLEDCLIPFAWLCAIGHMATTFVIYSFAPIIHSWDMQLHRFGKFLLYFRLGAAFYNISILLIKLSMLIQVKRVFVAHRSKTYHTINVLIWGTSAYHAAAGLLVIFNCTPIEKAWKPWIDGHCLPVGSIAMATTSINVFTDLAILAIAQKVIWGALRRNKKRLSFVFCASIVPCAFAVLCLVYNARMIYSSDFVYDAAIMSLACHGEITGGMFVLFMSIVPNLAKHVKSRVQSMSQVKSKPRAPSRLDFADIGVPEPVKQRAAQRILHVQKERSMWHISYTQRGGEDGNGEAFWSDARRSEDTIVAGSVESKEGLEVYVGRKC